MAILEVEGFTKEDYTLPFMTGMNVFDDTKEIDRIFVRTLLHHYYGGFIIKTLPLEDVKIDGVTVKKIILKKNKNLSGDDVYRLKYDGSNSFNVKITLDPKKATLEIESEKMLPRTIYGPLASKFSDEIAAKYIN